MIQVGILTISDRSFRKERQDAAGPMLEKIVQSRGWQIAVQGILPDEESMIHDTLTEWVQSSKVDIILTTGGTGFSPRDVTPEATRRVIEREAPGLAEVMRAESLKATPHAMLSRAVSGIRGRCLIVNLPGSPKAAGECLQAIIAVLPHAVQLLKGDASAEASH
jgi:molybdenum cofactor synthesis domain-containing protein